MVPRERFELSQPHGHYALNVACLPIPPPRQSLKVNPALVEERGEEGQGFILLPCIFKFALIRVLFYSR